MKKRFIGYWFEGFRLVKRLGKTGLICLGLTMLIYVLLFQRRVLLDITAQVQTLVKVCQGEVALPPTAMFYGCTWLAAFGSCTFFWLMGAAVVTLSLFGLAKFLITRHIFEDFFGESKTSFEWLALALGLVCSLPTPDWWSRGQYIIGQASPNYWMNGTLAVSYPFAILLFWQSYRQLQHPEAGWWRRQMLLIVLLALSKPSYLFVYVLVYPIFLIGHHFRSPRVLLGQLAPIGLVVLLLAVEYYLVFTHPRSVYVHDFNRGNPSGVVVRPLEVWRLYSSNIPLSILASVFFPLVVAGLYWAELRTRLLFWYAWAGFAAAIIVSAAFMQTGEEFYTWNFRYQHYIAAYLLFLVSALFVWEKIRAGRHPSGGAKLWWCVGVFALHLASGFVYLAKMWWSKSHY